MIFECRLQDRGNRMGIGYDVLWQWVEGSPQNVPRGLERTAYRKLQHPSLQVHTPVPIAAIGGA